MMPTNMAAPELLCAVRAGRAVMLEMWFIGGDGSRDDPALLTMIGELDSHSARPVPAAAEGLIQRTGPWVIFDFSGVTLMDGRGLALLTHLRHLAERRGGRVAVSRPRRPVGRVLQLAGCDEGLVLQGTTP
jgi:anti-anti-sigma factor